MGGKASSENKFHNKETQKQPQKPVILPSQQPKIQQSANKIHETIKGERTMDFESQYQVLQPLSYPYSAIGYIRTFKGGRSHDCGTGTLIGRNIVLTNASNVRLNKTQRERIISHDMDFDWKKYEERQAYFYLGVNGPISKAARQIKIKSMHFLTLYEESKISDTENIDYAILQLDTEEDLRVQFGSLGIDTTFQNDDNNAHIVGYPGDLINKKRQQQGIREECAYLFGNNGKIRIHSDGAKLMYELKTSPGQTGSPVFVKTEEGQYYIIGIHRGKYDGNTNFGVKMNAEVRRNIEYWQSSFAKSKSINWKPN